LNFRRTLIKLTLGYMVLIMLVTGLLSFALYKVGSRPFERRIELRQDIFEEPLPPHELPPRFEPVAVREVKHNLALFLVYFNVGVLCLAGLASYGLAKRELKPMVEAMELQSRFTSDAAHELRTPLTAMKAEIEVTLRGKDLQADETRELLESNLEEIDKLETLSSSLLKLALYEEGVKKEDLGTIQLSAIVDESVDRIKHSAAARGIKVDLELDDVAVRGDRASLVEMLVVLLDNSVRYSDDDTTITIATRPQKRHAVLTVKDEGYGIEQSDLAHVFKRFYRGRLPAEKKQVEGYGLGLSIAKRIAEMHHGSMEIESAPGEGTTVAVRLPLAHGMGQAGGA